MMKFENIEDLLEYLVRKTENGDIQFEHSTFSKTRNLLTRFPHNPRLTEPEIRSYNTPSLVQFKKSHPYNKVVNPFAKAITMFDFDNSVVYFVEFGDLESDGRFLIEVEGCDMMDDHEIKSNAEAEELLKEYNREVEYDYMNDSVSYGREYQWMKEKKAERNSEIVRMFENFTI